MAGSGKVPKPRSNGHRKNETADVPNVAVSVDVPDWPLGEDLTLKAFASAAAEALAEINADIEGESDGRKLGGLRRRQQAARDKLVLADLKVGMAHDLELEIWRDLWSLPQAGSWRAQGYFRELAQYARHKARAEGGSLDDAREARQWSDRLGLSPRAAAQMGLKFAAGAPVPAGGNSRPPVGGGRKVTSLESRRNRLTS